MVHNVPVCLILFCRALIVMGKYKVHAYLRITQSTFFYCFLIGLDKKGFLQPGNACQEDQQSEIGNSSGENQKSLSLTFIWEKKI